MAKNKWMILLAVLLLLTAVPTARAAESGSIQVCGIEGAVVLYPVATPDGTLKENFEDAASNIPDETNAVTAAKALWAYALAEKIPGQSCQADAEGNALFSPLEQGVYLIGSAADVPEFAPFLVRVPTVINGKQVYHIEAAPKQEEPEPTAPTDPAPTPPSPNIPQTGNSVIPKYMLMTTGILVTLTGLYQMIRGKEESYE